MVAKHVLSPCWKAVEKKILSVGSGDGSQQRALVNLTGCKNLVSTFFDSRKDVMRKYPDAAESNLAYLSAHCRSAPLFHIDATKSHEYFGPSFDCAFFTNPHLGIFCWDPGCKSAHEELLYDSVISMSRILKPGGELHFTLKSTSFYKSWHSSLLEAANKVGLVPAPPEHFYRLPGHISRTTLGRDKPKSNGRIPNSDNATTFVFQNVDEAADVLDEKIADEFWTAYAA